MSTRCSKNNKMNCSASFASVEYVKTKFGNEVKALRKKYEMMDLIMGMSELHAQIPTLLYLVEKGEASFLG